MFPYPAPLSCREVLLHLWRPHFTETTARPLAPHPRHRRKDGPATHEPKIAELGRCTKPLDMVPLGCEAFLRTKRELPCQAIPVI